MIYIRDFWIGLGYVEGAAILRDRPRLTSSTTLAAKNLALAKH